MGVRRAPTNPPALSLSRRGCDACHMQSIPPARTHRHRASCVQCAPLICDNYLTSMLGSPEATRPLRQHFGIRRLWLRHRHVPDAIIYAITTLNHVYTSAPLRILVDRIIYDNSNAEDLTIRHCGIILQKLYFATVFGCDGSIYLRYGHCFLAVLASARIESEFFNKNYGVLLERRIICVITN